MKQAAILISIFVVFTAAASTIAGWPFSAAASLGAVMVAAAWVTGQHLIEPFKAWLEWKHVERDALAYQRRVHEFDELFGDIVDHGEPSDSYAGVEEATFRLASSGLDGLLVEEIWPVWKRGGWMIGVALNEYPDMNPAALPDNYEGYPLAYRVVPEQEKHD